MKKFLSLVLTIAMVATMCVFTSVSASAASQWDGSAATSFAGGSGTETNPYQIATAAQLAYFAQSINTYSAGKADYRAAYVVLTKDIDLNMVDWTPIGNTYANYRSGQYFRGNFDGQGHTVSNMAVEIKTSVQYSFWGLFGMCNGASIKSLTVAGTITNKSSLTAIGGNMIGGIVGYGCAEISNCVSKVDITLTAALNTCYVGGIFGNSQQSIIKNCINQGNISANNEKSGAPYIGGIAGSAIGVIIDSCKNAGDISSYMGTLGGIVGQVYTNEDTNISYSSQITNSFNKGNVTLAGTSGTYAGGIAGSLSTVKNNDFDNAVIEVTNSVSTGLVTDSDGKTGEIYAEYNNANEEGGVITVSNCYYLNEMAASTNEGCEKITESDLTSPEFLNKLNAGGSSFVIVDGSLDFAWQYDMRGTTVKFSVDPTYTVTIPAEVELSYDEGSTSYKGSGAITTDAVRLGKGQDITVKVDGDFTMISAESAELPYEVTIGNSEAVIVSGATVATFGTNTSAQSVTLNYSAANPTYAGNYTDTLTFTISAPVIG